MDFDHNKEWRRYAALFLHEAKEENLSQENIDACLSYAKPLLLRGLPVIYDGWHLAELCGYTLSYISGVCNRRSRYYRSFQVKKRSW